METRDLTAPILLPVIHPLNWMACKSSFLVQINCSVHFQADQTHRYLFEKQNDLKFPNKAPGWHNKIILLKNFTPKRNNSFDGHIGQIVNSD